MKLPLGQKGKNLATHEDIQMLVEQMQAVTKATKEIEAKILDEVWNRQRRWEMKRDVLFEIARNVGQETDAMTKLYSVYMTEKANIEKGGEERTDRRIEMGSAWNKAAAEYEGTLTLASAVCGAELVRTLYDFGRFMRDLSIQVTDGNPNAFDAEVGNLTAKSRAIALAVRKELEIPETS
jgi:hypothetical protein